MIPLQFPPPQYMNIFDAKDYLRAGWKVRFYLWQITAGVTGQAGATALRWLHEVNALDFLLTDSQDKPVIATDVLDTEMAAVGWTVQSPLANDDPANPFTNPNGPILTSPTTPSGYVPAPTVIAGGGGGGGGSGGGGGAGGGGGIGGVPMNIFNGPPDSPGDPSGPAGNNGRVCPPITLVVNALTGGCIAMNTGNNPPTPNPAKITNSFDGTVSLAADPDGKDSDAWAVTVTCKTPSGSLLVLGASRIVPGGSAIGIPTWSIPAHVAQQFEVQAVVNFLGGSLSGAQTQYAVMQPNCEVCTGGQVWDVATNACKSPDLGDPEVCNDPAALNYLAQAACIYH